MITKAEMLPLLLEASPSFGAKWGEFLGGWRGQSDPPLYNALGDFARHVVGLLEIHNEPDLTKVFAVVERLHIEGDHFVKEAVTVGLLENLQNLNMHKSTTPVQFAPYLGTESRRWWKRVNDFWEEGKLLADD